MGHVDFKDLTLFIPGPTYVRPEILEAGKLPVFGHRDSEATKRLQPITENLRKIAGIDASYSVILFPGSGSNAMEASIRSLANDDEQILVVSVGAFGDLFYEIAQKNGKKTELLKFEPGKAIDFSALEEKLETLRPAVVTITHNETSTGVINNAEKASKLVRAYNALPIVDGVSIFGGAHSMIMEGNIAVYLTSTQKCLGLPAGLGIAFVSRDALEKSSSVKNKGYLTDLVTQAKSSAKLQTINTTPTQLANQLYAQTEYIVGQEGISSRFERHKRMHNIVLEWLDDLGTDFSLFPENKDVASPSLTCIRVPETMDRKAVKKDMKDEGYLFDGGYFKLNAPTIRIAHMGDITESMLVSYLNKLGPVLKKHI